MFNHRLSSLLQHSTSNNFTPFPKPLLPTTNLLFWNTKPSEHILCLVQFQLAKVSIGPRPLLGRVAQQRVLLPVELQRDSVHLVAGRGDLQRH